MGVGIVVGCEWRLRMGVYPEEMRVDTLACKIDRYSNDVYSPISKINLI